MIKAELLTQEYHKVKSVPGFPACLLDRVHDFLGRFVVYPSEHAQIAHALWVVHTHLMDKWESTPRLAFLSPERSSGKTRALEITETLVPRPVQSVNNTPAFLFRKISDPAGLPTILFDEVDTIFGPKAKEHEEIRAALNAGHRPGATAGRCVTGGKRVRTEELPVYCAVALAGLGDLPDTIISRSIVIQMRRRAPTEPVEPYRRRIHAPEGNALREMLARWAVEIRPTLAIPKMPDGIRDRDADVWEPLLSIADASGGEWPQKARVAAVTLVTLFRGVSESLGVRLLRDLRTVFEDKDVLPTTTLLESLYALEESPWSSIRDKPLSPLVLANLLRKYSVSSKTVRVGGNTYKGYRRDDLYDAWERYLHTEDGDSLIDPPRKSVTPVTPVTSGDLFEGPDGYPGSWDGV